MNIRRLPPPEPVEEPSELYPPEPEMHLRDYFYVLIKRRWLIIAIAIAVAAVSTVRALLETPQYSSTAVVQITRGKLSVVSDVVENETWIRELYPTQQRVLRSRTLAQRVVDQTKLWQHPLFGSGQNTEPSQETRDGLAGTVQSMVGVNHVRETQLLEVKFTTPDPELSARLANTLVRQYMSFSGEAQTDVARNTASFIREQIEKLQQDIQRKEQLLQDYSRKDNIVMVDEKESIVIQKLGDLNAQLTKAQAARVETEARYQSLRSTNPGSAPSGTEQPVRPAPEESAGNAPKAIRRAFREIQTGMARDAPDTSRARGRRSGARTRDPRGGARSYCLRTSGVSVRAKKRRAPIGSPGGTKTPSSGPQHAHRRLQPHRCRVGEPETHATAASPAAFGDRIERRYGAAATRQRTSRRASRRAESVHLTPMFAEALLWEFFSDSPWP